MKIGIITIHKSEVNYGASLQCYALWRYVTNLGYDCEVIDLLRPCHKQYVPGAEEVVKLKTKPNFFKAIVSNLRNYSIIQSKKKKINNFSVFNNKIRYSHQYKSVASIYDNPPDYDAYISGSDQVWNPQMPFENEPYLLGFVKNGGRKLAYASSFGVSEIDHSYYVRYSELLSAYNAISVREDSGAHIVDNIIHIKPPVVLDPVFLLTADEWRKESAEPSIVPNKPFILVYLLSYNKYAISHAINVAQEHNLDIYVVTADNKALSEKCITQIFDAGPSEWLWLIDNATYVLTNSFHGTSFSILMGKSFAVYQQEGVSVNTRVSSILRLFKLENHIVSFSDKGITKTPAFSYDLLQKEEILKAARKESINYLIEAISNDKN